MTETVRDDQPTTAPDAGAPPRRGPGPVRAGLLAAVVFVVGLATGALAVGVLAEQPLVVEAEPGVAEPDVPAGELPEGASGEVEVDAACLRAVNAAQDAFGVIDDLGEAAAALDAARLDEIVRRLMPVQDRLAAGLDACDITTEVEQGGGGQGGGDQGGAGPTPGESFPPEPVPGAEQPADPGE